MSNHNTTTTITNRTIRTIALANAYYLTANRNAHAAQIAKVCKGITSAHEAINAMWAYSYRIAPSFTDGAHDNPAAGADYLATLGPRQLLVQAMADECYRLNSFADDAAAVAMWLAGNDVLVPAQGYAELGTFWETDLDDNDEPFSPTTPELADIALLPIARPAVRTTVDPEQAARAAAFAARAAAEQDACAAKAEAAGRPVLTAGQHVEFVSHKGQRLSGPITSFNSGTDEVQVQTQPGTDYCVRCEDCTPVPTPAFVVVFVVEGLDYSVIETATGEAVHIGITTYAAAADLASRRRRLAELAAAEANGTEVIYAPASPAYPGTAPQATELRPLNALRALHTDRFVARQNHGWDPTPFVVIDQLNGDEDGPDVVATFNTEADAQAHAVAKNEAHAANLARIEARRIERMAELTPAQRIEWDAREARANAREARRSAAVDLFTVVGEATYDPEHDALYAAPVADDEVIALDAKGQPIHHGDTVEFRHPTSRRSWFVFGDVLGAKLGNADNDRWTMNTTFIEVRLTANGERLLLSTERLTVITSEASLAHAQAEREAHAYRR